MAKVMTDLEIIRLHQGVPRHSILLHRRAARATPMLKPIPARPQQKQSISRSRPTDLDILRRMQYQQYTYGNTWLFDATPFIALGIVSALAGLAALALLS